MRNLAIRVCKSICLPKSTLRYYGTTTTAPHSATDHHGEHSEYNEPTGYLFNRLPGEPFPKDRVRDVFIAGYIGGLAIFGILYYYKPDTSAETASMNTAMERMKARGQDPELFRYKEPQFYK